MFKNEKEKTIYAFCIAIVITFILGVIVGDRTREHYYNTLDEQVSKPVFDKMEMDYKHIVNKWHECNTELIKFQQRTGFRTADEYDSTFKIIEKSYEDEFVNLYKERKEIEHRKKELFKKEHKLNKYRDLFEKVLTTNDDK